MLSRNKKIAFSLLVFLDYTGAAKISAESNEDYSPNRYAIEEVVVTARKKEENLQDIPIAATAFGAESLESLKIQTSSELSAHVPNLQMMGVHGELRPVYSIRGLSMIDASNNTSSPTGVYVDENYLGLSFMRGFQLYDLERVEVLRGPQGTLYGKNTTGGAINFITRKPSFETGFSFKAGLGSHGRQEYLATAETPFLEDRFAIRVAHNSLETDGYTENHLAGEKDLDAIDMRATRVSLAFEGDSLKSNLIYSHAKNKSTSAGNIMIGVLPDPNGTDDLVNFNGYSRSDSFDSWEAEMNVSDTVDTETELVTLRFDWAVTDWLGVTSVTATADSQLYLPDDVDGSPNRLYEAWWEGDVTQISQDIRAYTTGNGPLSVTAGFYYAEEDLDVHNLLQLYGDPNCCIPIPGGLEAEQDYNQVFETKAFYTQAKYELTENTSVNLGLRYTEDEGELRDAWATVTVLGMKFQAIPDGDVSNILEGQLPTTPYDPTLRQETVELADDNWSGEIGIDSQIFDNVMAYAKYSRGYRSGAFNGNALWSSEQLLESVEPEFVDAYEMGFKSRWLDDSIQVNAAAFYYDYEDQQFINVVNLQAFLENAGKSTVSGMELEFLGRLTDRLNVSAGLGLLNTEYEELVLNNPENGGLTGSGSSGEIDLSGNELVLAPEVNFNLSLDYTIARLQSGTLSAIVDTVYVDDQWFSAFNDKVGFENIRSDDYWMSNALLTWTSSSEHWIVNLWVKNIEENDEPVFAINFKPEGGFEHFKVAAPRRYGLDVTYNFF